MTWVPYTMATRLGVTLGGFALREGVADGDVVEVLLIPRQKLYLPVVHVGGQVLAFDRALPLACARSVAHAAYLSQAAYRRRQG